MTSSTKVGRYPVAQNQTAIAIGIQAIMTQADPEKAELTCTPPATVQSDDDQHKVQSASSTRIVDSDERSELDEEYPRGIKLALIMMSLYLAVFLVALVRDIHPHFL